MFCPLYLFERGVFLLHASSEYVLQNSYIVFIVLLCQSVLFFLILFLVEFTSCCVKSDRVGKIIEKKVNLEKKELENAFIDLKSLQLEVSSLELEN